MLFLFNDQMSNHGNKHGQTYSCKIIMIIHDVHCVEIELCKDRVLRFHVLASEIGFGKKLYSPVEPLHLVCHDARTMELIRILRLDPWQLQPAPVELEVQSASKETDGHRTCNRTCHKAQRSVPFWTVLDITLT